MRRGMADPINLISGVIIILAGMFVVLNQLNIGVVLGTIGFLALALRQLILQGA